jgi:hypothetical protein
MAYILRKDWCRDDVGKDVASFAAAYDRYLVFLSTIEHRLPAAAREFALASWHYDFADHRAPHDAWIESVEIAEIGAGNRHRHRHTNIRLRLLGAYHDGHIELEYSNVNAYRLGSKFSSHGDWGYDEVTISDRDVVVHAIELGGEIWSIECADIRFNWCPEA